MSTHATALITASSVDTKAVYGCRGADVKAMQHPSAVLPGCESKKALARRSPRGTQAKKRARLCTNSR
jgi:hypothetical protein